MQTKARTSLAFLLYQVKMNYLQIKIKYIILNGYDTVYNLMHITPTVYRSMFIFLHIILNVYPSIFIFIYAILSVYHAMFYF